MTEANIKRSEAMKIIQNNPIKKELLRKLSKDRWVKNRETMVASLKLANSSDEKRAKTSEITKKRWNTNREEMVLRAKQTAQEFLKNKDKVEKKRLATSGFNNSRSKNVMYCEALYPSLKSFCEHIGETVRRLHYLCQCGVFEKNIIDNVIHIVKKKEISKKKIKVIIDNKMQCSKCKKTKDTVEFVKNSIQRLGYSHVCRSCQKEWRDNNKEGLRDSVIKRSYGISLIQYKEMINAQNGKCAICGVIPTGIKKDTLNVDHDHETGKVRGLLCRTCNIAIGLLKENVSTLNNAISYIVKNRIV